ncbi:MAG: class I SAM-dependent methyltransferase [Vulcanibacillus sp.]
MKRVAEFSKHLNSVYIERDKKSILELMDKHHTNELIVIEDKHAKFYNRSDINTPFFFHPSMAALRINRLKLGDNDLMIQLAELKTGDTFLDCTLGLASDSIVASYVVGSEGKVVGLESENVLATIVKDGLINSIYEDKDLTQAMRNIEVININHLHKLRSLPENSFDVVYMDPMFRIKINNSTPISPLRTLANQNSLLVETITEARRVAKRKVILKETTKSNEFERLGFKKVIRSSSVTYGVITIGEIII